MKMKTILMNKNSQKTKKTKNLPKTMMNNKAQTKNQTPTKKTAMNNLHNNHWRPKTTPSNKWVSENEEVPKWITWWTEKKRKRKIRSGKIRDKTILETSQIKNKTKITSKAALEEISSTVISDKPNLNIRKRRKKSKIRKLMKIKWKKRKNTKNLWGKFKPPLQKN